MPGFLRAAGWGDPEIERAARLVMETGLGTGMSAIDPVEAAWSESVAADLYRRVIVEKLQEGSFMEKLETQLSGASRSTHLLCAELLFLRVLPLTNVGSTAKRKQINTILGWSRPQETLPADLDGALGRTGVFNGGAGFNIQAPRHLGWLLSFVRHWSARPDAERAAALNDPWAFRELVDAMPEDQLAIRNSLLYLAFPSVFLPIVSQGHKQAIRNAFASVIGGSTGKGAVSTDRDLFAIHSKHRDMAGEGESVDYYTEPYLSQWMKPRDDGRRAWLVRPGPTAGVVDEWRSAGVVSLPATHLPVLRAETTLAQIRAMVEESYGHEDYVRRLGMATEFDIFCHRMKVDDIIVAVLDKDRVHAGVLTGEAERAENEGGPFSRAMAWNDNGPVAVAGLPAKLRPSLAQPGTFVDLTRDMELLLPLLDGGPVDPVVRQTPLKPASSALAAEVHMDEPWLQRVVELLEDRRQIVLYGPPGTGKTFLARALAHHLTGGEAVRLVQFHPSYSYEDFFEGFRPEPSDSGGMAFKLRPGPLRRLASAAQAAPETPHILIIDEINRGNLAKIFGELYFLLEYRDELIHLQYSPDEPFSLPPNVYFIATMNTVDRSIALIDAAMRRRFAFVELHPETDPVRGVLERWLKANNKSGDRARLLQALNAEIRAEDRDLQIGPSYLMTPENDRPGGLERVWEHSILPVLEEHYYGRLSRDEIHARFGLASIEAKAAT